MAVHLLNSDDKLVIQNEIKMFETNHYAYSLDYKQTQ